MFHFVTSPAQSAQVFAVSLRFPVILGSAMDKDRALSQIVENSMSLQAPQMFTMASIISFIPQIYHSSL